MKSIYTCMIVLVSLLCLKNVLISLNTASTFQVLLIVLGVLVYIYIAIKTKFFTQINFKFKKK